METAYYKPSGKISPKFFLYFLLFMVVSIPILSVAYIYINHYIPFIYLNFFITVGCGLAVGVLAGFAAKRGKARNPKIVYLCVFIAMVVMKYVQWAVYIPLIFSEVYGIWHLSFGERLVESFYLLFEPDFVLYSAQFINEFGVWGLEFSPVVRGVPLLIVWIGEFVLMTGAAIFMSSSMITAPFSEEMEGWYTELPEKIEIDIPQNFEYLKQDMENGNFTQLIESVRAQRIDPVNFLRITVFQPPEGALSEPFFLNVEQVTNTIIPHKKKSKEQTKTKTEKLITHIAVDRQSMMELVAPVERTPPPEPQPPVSYDSYDSGEETEETPV